MSDRRLIEESFPLKEVSEHSKHEKNVRHGHISTLHIWPARRPLAACRAAIIAALMPDPGDEAGRHELNKKIASITKWKTEGGPALDYFRQEIRKAYGGRAPKVLDMFAGGGAIPLEAMRLGCDVTAIDYNPVAWFILKCTLEFPQRLAGKTWPLPADETMQAKLKTRRPVDDDADFDEGDGVEESSDRDEGEATNNTHAQLDWLSGITEDGPAEGNLADHVRYWGEWVLEQARKELEPYYPTVNGQPTVAYLWARTVPCPDPKCGCEIPLLKTLWLCKKAEKTLPDTPENRARPDFLRIKRTKNTSRVVINGLRALRILAPKKGEGGRVGFAIWTPGPKDEVPGGTMSGSTARCPSCGIAIDGDYIKQCGHEGKLLAQMIAVVIDTGSGKEYRLPTTPENAAVEHAEAALPDAVKQIPYGLPTELLPESGNSGAGRAFTVPLYGFRTWADLFTKRQLLALTTFVKWTLRATDEMQIFGYSASWIEALKSYLALLLNRLVNYTSTICIWEPSAGEVKQTFLRFALPITWDFAECNPVLDMNRYYRGAIESVDAVLANLINSVDNTAIPPVIVNQDSASATGVPSNFDAIITDPPYYDAIPYADLADFFYVWLRRTLGDMYSDVFSSELCPKVDELVQQRDIGDNERKGKLEYEAGMISVFHRAWRLLAPDGHMVVVFAHKQPEAWETLTTGVIQAGFTVTASWPIETEQAGGVRTHNRASLASSIWLVCRKRSENTEVGRYRSVRRAMEERITERLRYFWDIGLGGPDFVWAAVGPALESYSAYSEVKRMDGSPFTVSEFLKEVRRMVADFALGQILKGQSTEGLDEWTRYYLLHRSSFDLNNGPVGECILMTQGYGLDLNELRSERGYIRKGAGKNTDADPNKGSSSEVRLAKWDERTRDDLGQPHPSGGLPIIDALHHLMHLWAAGSLDRCRQYVAEQGLGQNEPFWAVAQAILEMAEPKSRERTLLEAIVAWGRGRSPEELAHQQALLDTSGE